jgi:hypothetical protein
LCLKIKERKKDMNNEIQKTEFHTQDEAYEATANADWQDEFDGMNCDSCLGWDGHSRRCDCGNRRVVWDIEQQTSGKWMAIARAW